MLFKGRRTGGGIATGSAGYSSPAPSTGYSGTGTQRSTRLAASDFNQGARQSPLPRRQTPSVEAEEDAEGEEDDGNEEDKNLYCFCQKLSYGTVSVGYPRLQYALFTIFSPQMVGCDDEDCQYQWVTSIPSIRDPLILLLMFLSSMWGVLGLKILQRVVGTVLNVLPDVVRNLVEGRRGKEGRKTSVTDISCLTSSLSAPLLSHVICTC